jgi:tetratricopeptide (TPR) repeat protein
LTLINENRRVIIGFAAMIIFLSAIYFFGIKNALIFDDSLLLADNFRETYGRFSHLAQRFLSYGSFFWVEALVGEGWWKQRVVNLALHFTTAIMLFKFYRTLIPFIQDKNPLTSRLQAPEVANRDLVVLLSVAFFALNPMAVYAVAYLIQRSILMATLAVVLGLWFFTRALISGQKKFFALAFLAYVAALAAKEHALLAPLCAVPLYIFIRRPTVRQMLRMASTGTALTIIAGGGFALIYGQIVGTAFDEFSKAFLTQLEELSPGIGERAWPLSILNQMHLFTQYGWRWLLPLPGALSIDLRPPFPLSLLSYPHIFGALAYLLTLFAGIGALLRWRDARSLVGLSLLIALILHGTEFAVVWIQDPFVLYRSYLWAIGIPGLLIALLYGAPTKSLLIGAPLVATLLTVGSIERVLSLASPINAWGDAITKLSDDPRSVGRWRPYLNRGEAYMDSEMYEAAIRDFSAADKLGDPGQYAQFNRGAALYMLKKPVLAISAFDLAEKKDYSDPDLYYQRGLAQLAVRNFKAAHIDFDQALHHGLQAPLYWSALAQRGTLSVDLGDSLSAIKDLEEVMQHDPDNRMARLSLGIAQARSGDPQQAKQLLTQSLQQTPAPLAYYGRALAAYRLGEKSTALADIEAAIKLDEKNPGFPVLRDKIRALH